MGGRRPRVEPRLATAFAACRDAIHTSGFVHRSVDAAEAAQILRLAMVFAHCKTTRVNAPLGHRTWLLYVHS